MGIAALLYPQVFQVELLPITVRPEKIAVPLECGDDVLVIDEGDDPFLLGPNSGSVWVSILMSSVVEEPHPCGRSPRLQRGHVMMYFKQVLARGAPVDALHETELPLAAVDALKPCVIAHIRPLFV